MKKIPEVLLKCCDKTRKPRSIKFLDDYIKITFFCPFCQNWVILEYRNGIKKMLSDVDLDKQLSYKYLKK